MKIQKKPATKTPLGHPYFPELHRLFNNTWTLPTVFEEPFWDTDTMQAFLPSSDVLEGDKSFSIVVDVPGFDPKDIEVEVVDHGIVISAKKEEEKEEKEKNYLRRERSSGSFYRKYTLPPSADLESVEGAIKNGTLTVTVLKKAGTKKNNIKIKVEK